MKVTQLSVFVENKKGRLAEAVEAMAKAKINIRALSLADTADFGVLRVIVDSPDKAAKAMKDQGMVVKTTDVIAVEVEDKPGGLNNVLKIFKDTDINIEYMYAFVEKNNENAVLVFRVENTDEAIKTLTKKGLKILKAEEVYNI